MTLDQDEQLFVDALHRTDVRTPNLSETALRATRLGTRLRRRHQARAAVATLAVVGVGVGGAALASGGQPGRTAAPFADTPKPSVAVDTPTATPSQPAPTQSMQPTLPTIDTSSAYAVLDAPGWSAPLDNVIADEKLYYVQDGTDAGVSLNWRPSPPLGPKYTLEQLQAELESQYGGDVVAGTTTIDGDRANVYGDADAFTVVGPIKQGRFLTLSSTGLTLDEITELAAHVHRQEPAHLAGQPQ
jgi:hypothetical protein